MLDERIDLDDAHAAAVGQLGKPEAYYFPPQFNATLATFLEQVALISDIDTYDGDEVVLDDFLREMILLEAPIFPLCSEECPGIRAIPEVSSNRGNRVPKAVDPRLRPLLDMQTKK